MDIQIKSVFGRTGHIISNTGDYTSDQVLEGIYNRYFTENRVRSTILTSEGSYIPYGYSILHDNDTIISAIRKLNGNVEHLKDSNSNSLSYKELELIFAPKIEDMVNKILKEKLEEIVFMATTTAKKDMEYKKKFGNLNIVDDETITTPDNIHPSPDENRLETTRYMEYHTTRGTYNIPVANTDNTRFTPRSTGTTPYYYIEYTQDEVIVIPQSSYYAPSPSIQESTTTLQSQQREVPNFKKWLDKFIYRLSR